MNDSNNIRQDDSSSPSEESSPPAEHGPIKVDAPVLSAQKEESDADRELEPAAGKLAKVRVEYKHSLATRWMHWINFPLLFVMIYSGILIYWADSLHEGLNAHHVYRIGIGDGRCSDSFPGGSITTSISNINSHKDSPITSSSCCSLHSMGLLMSFTRSCQESGAT